MEDFTTVLTNFHKLGTFSEVSWYTAGWPGLHCPDQNNEKEFIFRFSELESQLFKNRLLAYAEPRSQCIWIFLLFTSTKEVVEKVISDSGLEISTSGALQRSTFLSPNVSEEEGQPGTEIYTRLCRSVSRALAYDLARHPSWLHVGPQACLHVDSLRISSYRHPHVTEVLFFRPLWQACGLFSVQISSRFIPKMISLSALTCVDEDLLRSEFPVLILPFGLTGTFHGFIIDEEASGVVTPKTFTLQQLILEQLAACLDLHPDPGPWVRIKMPLMDGLGNVLSGGTETMIIWPVSLCVCKLEKSTQDHEPADRMQSTMDPLTRAWLFAEKCSEPTEPTMGEACGEDYAQSYVRTVDTVNVDQHGPAKQPTSDVTSIYPSPPDGMLDFRHENHQAIVDDTRGNISRQNPIYVSDDTNVDVEAKQGTSSSEAEALNVTEADFEFFDTPEAPSLVDGEPQDIDTGPKVSPLKASPIVPELPAFTSQYKESQETLSNNTIPLSILENDTRVATPDMTPPSSPERDGPHRESSSPQKATSIDMDEKYLAEGRFGYDTRVPCSALPNSLSSPVQSTSYPQMNPLVEPDTESDTDSNSDGNSDGDKGFDGPATHQKPSEHRTQDMTDQMMCFLRVMMQNHLAENCLEFSDWSQMSEFCTSLLNFFLRSTSSPRQELKIGYSKTSPIELVQLVIDQTVYRPEARGIPPRPQRKPVSAALEHVFIDKTIKERFPSSEQYLLHNLPGASSWNSLRAGSMKSQCIQPIMAPWISVKRANASFISSVAIIDSWEVLGIEPLSGTKSIASLCIGHEDNPHALHAVNSFLYFTREAYQTCGLGSHQHLTSELGSYVEALRQGHEQFGAYLADQEVKAANIVIYLMVEDVDTMTACATGEAIYRIKFGYHNRRGPRSTCALVIQLVPKRFIFDPHILSLPSMEEYRACAFETYARCSRDAPECYAFAEPAFILQSRPPAHLTFEVTTDPRTVALYHDVRLHVSYAWTSNCRWLTAAWTNNTGSIQWKAAYWVGNEAGETESVARRVFAEVLATSLELLHTPTLPWQIFITKAGTINRKESEEWCTLMALPEYSKYKIILLAVNTDTAFECYQPPRIKKGDPSLNINDEIHSLATPVATPDSIGVSPEAISAHMPIKKTDVSEEIHDERWRAWIIHSDIASADPGIISQAIKASASGFLLRKSLAHGTLLKPISISIIHAYDDQERDHALLSEVAQMFHDLAILAQLTHVTNEATGLVPWHVAIVKRALSSLSSLFLTDEE